MSGNRYPTNPTSQRTFVLDYDSPKKFMHMHHMKTGGTSVDGLIRCALNRQKELHIVYTLIHLTSSTHYSTNMDPRERDERKFKQRHTQALLDKAYDEIVSSQLERLKSKKSYTENDEDAYRLKLEADRDRAAKKRRKVMSAEHEELARTTGLSGHVVALMASGDHDNSDSDDASRKRHHKRKSRRRTYDSDQDDSLGSEVNKCDQEKKSRKKKDYKKRKRDQRRSSPDDHKDRDHDGKRLSGENDSSKERYNRDNTDQYISSKHRDDDDQSSSDPSRKKTRKRRKKHSHKRK